MRERKRERRSIRLKQSPSFIKRWILRKVVLILLIVSLKIVLHVAIIDVYLFTYMFLVFLHYLYVSGNKSLIKVHSSLGTIVCGRNKHCGPDIGGGS